uniref:RNA-dependent RNA polymerase n=1 Tax=Partiti-like alassinovirus TaxID=2784746 RepID=A0A7S6YLE2_9VIRU|nr:RNA-dependent RNA polymerase [Partiti-like alassinovirus]
MKVKGYNNVIYFGNTVKIMMLNKDTLYRSKMYKAWLRNIRLEGCKIQGAHVRREGTEFMCYDKMLNLINPSNQSLDHLLSPNLRRFRKYFSYIVKLLRSQAGDLGRFKYSEVIFQPWLKTRLLSIRLPAVEHSMLAGVENMFGYLRGRLPWKLWVTHQDILDADVANVNAHCDNKNAKIEWHNLNSLHFFCAVGATILGFRLDGISQHYRMLRPWEALDNLPHDTSSGYPLFKRKDSPEAVSDAIGWIKSFEEMRSFSSKFSSLIMNPVVIFHRFTTKIRDLRGSANIRPDIKIRQVFGVSFRVMLLETMLFQKVIDFVSSEGKFHSIGKTRPEISAQVSLIRRNAFIGHRAVFCGDISGMDKNLPLFLVVCFFASLLAVVPFSGFAVVSVAAVAVYHCLTPILTFSGLYVTNGGNVTGSKLTSLLNTFCLSVVVNYFFFKVWGRSVREGEFFVQGDDFVVVLPRGFVYHLARVFGYFNLSINLRKSKYVTEIGGDLIDYLGFGWHPNGYTDNADKWWIAKVIYPERYVDDASGFFGRSFIRFCSIIFQLKRGPEIFDQFFEANPVLKKQLDVYLKAGDPIIYHMDKRGKTHLGRIPLSQLRLRNWTCY